MNMARKVTKTEWILLVMSVLFLLGLLGTHLSAGDRGAAVSVSTGISAQLPEPEIEEPPAAVDINTADAALLQTLPGIGEVLARRIIDWREANGPFLTEEDLLAVDGIGPATLEKIRGQITLGGALKDTAREGDGTNER